MNSLSITLLTDGSSDRALLPVLRWLLQQHRPNMPIDDAWADLGRFPKPPRSLCDRIVAAIHFYPCRILFIHRDAEGVSVEKREDEIRSGIAQAAKAVELPEAICVIPVRMTEAWLLFDEVAIRMAAGNPNGRTVLSLPELNEIEEIINPKEILKDLLVQASELQGRRRARFKTAQAQWMVSRYIDNFDPLRQLRAFRALEKSVIDVLDAMY